jgi:hypothetical protein
MTVAGLAIAGLAANGVLAASPAAAFVGEESRAASVYLDGTILGVDESAVLGIEGAQAEYVDGQTAGASTVDDADLDIQALSAIALGLPDLDLAVGDVLELAAVQQQAEAAQHGASSATTSTAGLGIALTELLDAPGVLSAARIDLGAVESDAALAEDGTLIRTTTIAGATATLQSPAVGDLVAGVNGTVSDIVGVADALEGGVTTALNGAIGTVFGLVGALTGTPTATTTVDVDTTRLDEAVSGLLTQTLSTDLVSIDLATGTITVDLAGGIDLDDLAPNSTLLSPELLQAVSADIAALLGELQTDLTTILTEATAYIDVTIASDASLTVPAVGSAGLAVDYDGSLQPLLDGSGPLTVGTSGLLAGVPLATIAPVLQDAIGVAATALNTAVAGAGGAVDTIVTDATDALNPVLDLVAELAQVNLNVQNASDGLASAASVTAVEVVLLPGTSALTLPLVTSTVGPNVQLGFTPSITATDVVAGESTAVTGGGWPADTEVSLQATGPDGDPVGGPVTATTTASGALPSTAYPIPADAPSGTYTMTATALDAVDAPTTLTATDAFEVADETAPAAPVIDTPADGSVTSDRTPTVSGTGEPGAGVDVSIDGAVIAEDVPVAADGTWSVEPTTPLADGEHTVSATQTDPSGNLSPAASNDFTVDGTAPGAPVIEQPADGSVRNDATPTVSGTGDPGATVQVAIDGTEVADDVPVDEDGTWSVDLATPLAEGDHVATATQTDPAGNVSPADSNAFAVDTTAPAAPVITGPADGSTITDTTPTITGTGEPGAEVEVTIDGDVIGTATVTPEGIWTLDATEPLADGVHDVEATQTDPAGNTSPADAVSFTLDSAAEPTAPVIERPESGSSLSDTTPTVSGTGIAGATVTVTATDGTVLGTALVGDDGSWAFDSIELVPGSYTITAVQEDAGGDVSPESSSVIFAIDTAAPAAPVITAPEDGVALYDATPTIVGTAEPGSTVTVVVDGAPVGEATADERGAWSLTPTEPLAEGEHEITATATDRAGNVSAPSAPVGIAVLPPPTVAVPDAPVYAGADLPVTGAGYPAGADVTVQLANADGDPVGAPVIVRANGRGGFTTTIPVPGDAVAGEHVVTGTTGDRLRAFARLAVYTPQVDAGGPVAPGGELPVSGDGFPPANEVEVVITDGDGDSIGEPVRVVTDDEGGFSVEVPIPVGAAPGDYTVVVTTEDGAVFRDALLVQAPGEGEISIEIVNPVRHRGEQQTTYGYGFLPGEVVTGVQNSHPLALGTQVADENGTVRFDWTIRSDEHLGTHTVVLTGETSGEVSATFRVVEDPALLASTGGVVWPAAALGTLVLGLGAYLVVRRRRESA